MPGSAITSIPSRTVLVSAADESSSALFKVATASSEAGTAPASIRDSETQRHPRRILLIQTQAENAGAQEISRLVGAGLSERGYEVFNLFFFRKSDSFDEPPNTVYCAPHRPGTPWAFAKFLWSLARQIKAIRPDVVLTFQHYGNIIGGVVSRLVSPAPVIANEVSAGMAMRWPVRAADIALGSLGVFSCITLNSRDMEREYARYPARYRARMTHVAHGFDDKSVDLPRDEARRRFGLPREAALLGCTARLHHNKRLDAAIRVLAGRPEWHLALAGQDADASRLKALAAELRVTDRVHFVGELSPQRIGEFLAALDVFVFPSAAETFGLAAVEAASAGIPSVVSDLPVLREVLAVEGRPAALFVDPADTKKFAAAVSQALGDDDLRNQLRQNARGLKSRYSVNTMVDEYVGIIKKFL